MMSYEEFKATSAMVTLYDQICQELIKHDGIKPKTFMEKIKHEGAKTALLQARAEIAKEVSPTVDLRV